MIGMHPFHMHKLRFTEISEIYTSETIKNLAYSLIGIFIPIYLLNNGLSLKSLCLLFIFQNLIRLVIEPVIGGLVAKKGAKHILALSYPFSFLYIILLALYPTYETPLLLIALIWALADSMHWVSYQSAFSKAKHKKKAGREISLLGILHVIVGAIGPILGGLVAVIAGLNAVFVIASILLVAAMIPLFQTLETVKAEKLNYKGVAKKATDDLIAHGALNFEVVIGTVIWPLFIYFIVKDYLQLGAIVSLSFLLSIVAIYAVGLITDSFNKKILIALGSIGMAVVNIFRSFATTFWQAFGVNLAAIIVMPLLQTPLFSIFYSHADRTRRVEYVVLMEMAGDAARTLLWLLLLLLILTSNQKEFFTFAFFSTAAILLFTNLVKLQLKKR